MHYNSVKEYFIKLQSRSLTLFLLPVITFLTLIYLIMIGYLTTVMISSDGYPVAIAISLLAVAEGFSAFIVAKALLKRVKPLVSLGERLDRYQTVSLIRFVLLVFGSAIIMAGFYLTGVQLLIIVYACYLIFFLFAWPTRSRVCTDLSLKAAECEVIFER